MHHTDPEPTIRVQQHPNSSQLFAGYDLDLSCSISVNTDIADRVLITAAWFKDGIEYNINWDSRISVSPVTLSANGVYTTTLSFMPMNFRDSGNYQCTATLTGYTGTTLSNATDSTTVRVEGINGIHYSFHDIRHNDIHFSDLPQTLIQLQLFGVQNCYKWMVYINHT